MDRRLSRIRALLFGLVLFIGPMLACEFSASTATITNAVMAKDSKGDTFEPVGITDTYPADQQKFHAIVSISSAPSNTPVKAVWTAVDVGNAAAPNTRIDQTEVKAEGTRNIEFTLAPDGDRFPPGTYKVEIYLNDKLNRTLNFSVAAPTATPTRAATATSAPSATRAATVAPTATRGSALPTATRAGDISGPTPQAGACPPFTPAKATPSGIVTGVVMALDADKSTKEPINPTTVFPVNAVFHAVVTTKNAPAGTTLSVSWYATDLGQPNCNEEIDTTDYDASGSENVDFYLTPKTTWPAGSYRAEVNVNNVLDRIVNFTVSTSAPKPGATTARPTATTAPRPTSTVPRPTAPPTAPPQTSACGTIPAGMGSVVFKSFYGQEILIDIGSKLYKVPPNGVSEPIYLAPNKYTYHAKINQYGDATADIQIQLGGCLVYTFSP